MNQLAVKEEVCFDTILKDVDVMNNMCAALMKTKHYAAMGEAGLFAIVQKAKSLGISPLEALNGGLFYVQGKVGMSTELMASLIRQQGHSIVKDPKSDNTICILQGKRKDNGDTWTISFSIDDAKRAGLFKNMYEKYPAVMLYNRACSMLARQLFPDVIKGCGYSLEELNEIKDSKPFVEKPPAIEPIQFEKITQEQFEQLDDMIGEDKVYRDKVMKLLKDHLHINSLLDLPEHMYNRVMSGAQKNAQDKLKQKEDTCKESIELVSE